jgi:TolA-binding protein
VKGSVRSTIVGLSFLLAGAGARAQVPPPLVPPSEAAEISACLCLQQGMAIRSAEMNQRTQALDAITHQLADLDGQLAEARANLNINNPDAVARYKALLERRDEAYRQSIGPVHDDAAQATARYNARVNEYNARCANRPFNSALVAELQAHLACPPVQ